MIKVEAVTVCVDYSDFLSKVAIFNHHHFDRWLVITKKDDNKTRHVCRHLGIDVLQTDDGGTDFNKGRMIERGLQHLSSDGWRLHIDADIALPSHFRRFLKIAELQEDHIYGVDRIMVQSRQQWDRLLASGYLNAGQHTYHHTIRFPEGFTLGSRWVSNVSGYVPIGFFQLWHSSHDEWSGIRTRPYPSQHNTACRTDVQHALQWDRRKRALIPEIIVAHIESERAALGANWKGRTTKEFK